MATPKVRVLIVDDSASVRQILTAILNDDPGIEVMAAASDPFVAAKRLQDELPDVIILDIEMPRMDGMTFLRKIMAQRPIPVIICSTMTEQGSNLMFEAFEAGAVDILPKPRVDTRQALLESSERLRDADSQASRGHTAGTSGIVGAVAGRREVRSQGASPAAQQAKADREKADGGCNHSAAGPEPCEAGRGTYRLYRGIDGWNGSPSRCSGVPAGAIARHSHCAAHAPGFYGRVRAAARRSLPDRREGGGRRRARASESRLYRTRKPPHAVAAARLALLHRHQGRTTGVAASSFRRRFIPVCRAICRAERAGDHHDGHGR